ncbi:MAG TPA: patatin-like phospholipase family protein [Mycobacteriales bacterium]|nr:patatin-like phospholipase family protein [Mycobacteriales bacterium]
MSRTLLVLGGGGSLGAFQVGGLLALAENGVVPDALFGCSAGALNAAFLASDPSLHRARELADWWARSESHRLLAPGRLSQLRGIAGAVATRASALLDERPLRTLVSMQAGAHDLSELAVPLTVTTTCLDCGAARHHDRGPLEDVLVASCSLPGLFPPVRLPDGHVHVDGGIVCGVPLEAALRDAGPRDVVYVLDTGMAPVTGTAGRCAALPDADDACGLGAPRRRWEPPPEAQRHAVDVVLRAFTVARAVANRSAVEHLLGDPRVRVAPHIPDAWATGLLHHRPVGPRDFRHTGDLVTAGFAVTARWLERAPAPRPAD